MVELKGEQVVLYMYLREIPGSLLFNKPTTEGNFWDMNGEYI